MIPRRLYIQNFMSIGTVDIDLHNQGLVLISGDNQDIQSANSNAAGKSSLFEALLWCYLGETYRGVNADKVARIVKGTGKVAPGGCAVVHEVERDGVTYRISRFRKHKKHKNGVFFEKIAPEQQDLTQSKVPQTNEMILRTLGIHPEILQQTTMIGQGMPWKFTDLTDADRKRVMVEMLHLHVWDIGLDDFRSSATGVQRQIEQSQAAITMQEEQLEGYQQALNLRRDELTRVQANPPVDPAEIRSLDGQIKESQEQIETFIVSLHSCKTEMLGLDGYLKQVTEERQSIYSELQALQMSLHKLTAERIESVQNLQNEARQAEQQYIQQQKDQKFSERVEISRQIEGVREAARVIAKTMTAAETKIEACKYRIAQLEQTLDTCPTCGRPGASELASPEIEQQKASMTEQTGAYQKAQEENETRRETFESFSNSLRQRDEEIKVFDSQLAEIATKTYPQVDTLIFEYDAKKQELDSAVTEKKVAFQAKDEAVTGLTKQKESHQRMFNNTQSKIEEQSTNINTKQRRLGELQALQSGWQAKIDAVKNAVSEAAKAHHELHDKISAAMSGRAVLDNLKAHYDWLAGACKKIRSLSMDEALGFINERLRYYMDIFTDGEIQVIIRPETENVTGGVQDKIDIQITTAGGVYKSGSGGEKRRIDLALYFSLSDLSAHVYGSHVTILVCDEIMDALDITGVYRCLDILRAKRDAGLSVFLTSQRVEILRGVTDFDKWWIMRKVDGISSLVDSQAVA